MRWFSLARKTTRKFLINSQNYHFHGGSSSHHAPNSMDQSVGFFAHRYSTTKTMVNSTQSSYRSINGDNKMVDLDIISREVIKPAFPTPHHLKTYNFSSIDQVMFDCYSPLILFLPNNDNTSVKDVVSKRSQHLKETLSEILTRFYPVAGEVKDNYCIECNDKGVHFVEARVNQTLEEFLRQPDDQKVRELIPERFSNLKSSIGNYVVGVQVNIFDCGGIGLCTSLAHKIFDAYTYFLFMKAWAATANGSGTISPSFVASEMFPTNHSIKYTMPTKLTTTKSLSTKRFFFDSSALARLKTQTGSPLLPGRGPTRMEATTAVIWKAATKAASALRPFSPQSPHVLLSMVNLRKRASPPLPNESIGNIVDAAPGVCFPESQPDLANLMGQIRESISKINPDHIESLKGEKGHGRWNGMMKMMNDMTDVMDEGDFLFSTSLLNSGIYDIDFGWGKPLWFYDMNAGFSRFAALNDTIKDGGVEAIVTLSSKEMEIFERDPAVLSYATVNPSPLQYLEDYRINRISM